MGEWLGVSEAHPLVKSSVFHYEFEFIHPFADGNGRTGRYWQTAILGKWKSAFYAAPIENIVWENQAGYYLAIRRSSLIGDSGPFLDFMLERILQAIRTKGEEGRDVGVNVGVNVGEKLSERERKVLDMLRNDGSLTAAKIARTCSLSTRQAERLLASLKKRTSSAASVPTRAGIGRSCHKMCARTAHVRHGKSFPIIGNIFSNHWKIGEKFFQSLENFSGGRYRCRRRREPATDAAN